MSLVGSLEDLGLGDILQIISLSGKSGLLSLHSESGEGQILFRDGAIRAAFSKDGPADLRDLIARSGGVAPDDLERAFQEARSRRSGLADVLVERGLASADRIDHVRRDNIERIVLDMFAWPGGEFSFEVSELVPPASEELTVSPGINPQFLALEGTRMRDEAGRGDEEDPALELDEGSGDAFEPLEIGGAEDLADAELEVEVESAEERPAPAPEPPASVDPLAGMVAETATRGASARGASERPRPATLPPVVVIEADLRVLEWVKHALGGCFPRVHIFQRSELGVGRVRQYLSRAEVPLLLLSDRAPADPLTGAKDAPEIARRLRAQTARMRVVLFAERAGAATFPAGLADATTERPGASQLADPRRAAEREACAAMLRSTLLACCPGARPDAVSAELESAADAAGAPASAPAEPAPLGEDAVAGLLRLAARVFHRVALFAVEGDQIVGVAERGLARAGGPDAADLREVRVPLAESAWVRAALEGGRPVRCAPSDDGDHRLAVLLGNTIPDEAWIAPLGQGATRGFLYGDNLPGRERIGETTELEAALAEPRFAAALPARR